MVLSGLDIHGQLQLILILRETHWIGAKEKALIDNPEYEDFREIMRANGMISLGKFIIMIGCTLKQV